MLSVLLVGALLCAATAFWVLRAYKRAGGGARSAFGALTACAIVGVLTLGAYLVIGRPELGGFAYAQRLEELKQRDPTTYTADEALAVLAEAAREDTQDPLPHFYAGQLLLNQARPREAAREFESALRREPRLAEAMVGLGRALVQINGQVTQEALDLFETATTLSDDPAPWLYLAMHAAEQGDAENLRRYANEAGSRMAADDPRQEMIRELNRRGR